MAGARFRVRFDGPTLPRRLPVTIRPDDLGLVPVDEVVELGHGLARHEGVRRPVCGAVGIVLSIIPLKKTMVYPEMHSSVARCVCELANDVAHGADVHAVPVERSRRRPHAEAFVMLRRRHNVARAGGGEELRPLRCVKKGRVEARGVVRVGEGGALGRGDEGDDVGVFRRNPIVLEPFPVERGHAEDGEVYEDTHLGIAPPLRQRARVERRPGWVVAHALGGAGSGGSGGGGGGRGGERGGERAERREGRAARHGAASDDGEGEKRTARSLRVSRKEK